MGKEIPIHLRKARALIRERESVKILGGGGLRLKKTQQRASKDREVLRGSGKLGRRKRPTKTFTPEFSTTSYTNWKADVEICTMEEKREKGS